MFVDEKRIGEPPPSEAKFILLGAEARLADPDIEWTKHGPLYGEPQDCLETAISRMASYMATPAAIHAIRAVQHVIFLRTGVHATIPAWNDMEGTTFADVMSVLAEAIEIVDSSDFHYEPDFCNFVSPPISIFSFEHSKKIATAMLQHGGKFDAANDAWYLPTGMSAPVMVPMSYFSPPPQMTNPAYA